MLIKPSNVITMYILIYYYCVIILIRGSQCSWAAKVFLVREDIISLQFFLFCIYISVIYLINTVYTFHRLQKPRIAIDYLHVMSDIRFRFATTLVTSKVANPANTSQEVRFDVTLPNEAFISDFQMQVRFYTDHLGEQFY